MNSRVKIPVVRSGRPGKRRTSLEAAVTALLALTLTGLAGAAEPAETADSIALQEIVVTGSRIAKPELQSTAPISIVTSASIESTGTINIADSLRDLPSVGSPALANNSSNFLTTDSGINTLNLRNLAESRTLVLVNGRRMTPGVAGTTEVDLNTIPTELIDHVEIVTGGASAIYGSDAVAGAVNFVLKKDFEGLQFNGQTGKSGSNDDGSYVIGMLFGTSFADSRGHFVLNVSRDKEDGLGAWQRKATAQDLTVTKTRPPYVQFSSYIPQGNFFVSSSAGGFDQGGDVFSFANDGSLIDGDFGPGFNRAAHRLLIVPVERTLINSMASYDLTDHHRAYAEITYADASANSHIEPLPLASNDIGAGGSNSIYGAALDANGDAIGMPITNYYFQNNAALAPIRDSINAWNATGANCTGSAATNPAYDCVKYVNFRRRLIDIADRTSSNIRQLHRIVLGVNGDLPFGDWKYDASYTYGRTTDSQLSTGSVNEPNFQQALNSIAGPDGTPVCADPVAAAQGCVPVNVFGVGSITPAAAKYLSASITRDAAISEQVISGSISGTIGELPAGRPSLVLGVEGRKDESSEIWDPLTNAGLNGSNTTPNVEGSITVREAFLETEVPIVKDLPAFKSLDLNGAFRQAHYDTSGNVNAWKIGLNWAVVPDVRLRAVYSRAVRAPNVGELFSGVSQSFVQINDPCDGTTAATTGAIATACRAIPGVAQAIAQNGVFSYTALDNQNQFGLLGGNPHLSPEKSKTKTFGLVLTPSALPGFSATIDYFDIRVEGAVSTVNQNNLVANCLLTGSATFCDNVVRNAGTGKVTEFFAFNQNVGYIRSSGIDTAVRYRLDLPRGNLTVSLAETHQLKLEQAQDPGSPVEIDLGQLNASGRLGAGFKDKGVLNLDYAVADFEATWRTTYLSKIQDATDPTQVVYAPLNNVPAYWYHDAQVRYTWGLGDKTKLSGYVGVNNVFNKKPPFLPGGMNSNVTGSTTADSYDEIGVYWYAGFKLKF